MAAAIRGTFQRQVRRVPTEEEAAKYLDFLKKNLAETSDPVRSLRATLTSIYLSPEAIYRMEWGLGKTDEHGRRMLSPKETAAALNHALFDLAPMNWQHDANGKKIRLPTSRVRLYAPHEVARLLRETGFEVDQVHGGLTGYGVGAVVV